MSSQPRLRCAVYTRKSTEEGLDQEFNSLDAQREACVAYIASQVGLGWTLIPDRYDDGGISGGTMERPALQRLLLDIRAGRVDVVVVYKIDRLTRSLGDFSKIVEVFDANSVSFVSVTQQFNTTTSMGRLTLNVLLSFAQFEREVTAERIRDKIAASKKKGMWMGGVVPLGYRVENRKLLIKESEAETVRHLFQRYLKLGSVRMLVEETAADHRRGKLCASGRGGGPFGRGHLYHLLSNPIYVGKIRHRDLLYEGAHQPIVDPAVFAKAQALLADKAPKRSTTSNQDSQRLLTGIIFDETGDRLTPSSARKGGKLYRYYISSRLMQARRTGGDGWRVPAAQLESMVERQMILVLANQAQLADWIREAGLGDRTEGLLLEANRIRGRYEFDGREEKHRLLRAITRRIELRPAELVLDIDRQALLNLLINNERPDHHSPAPESRLNPIRIQVPIAIKRRGVETRMVLANGTAPAPQIDPALIHLLARAHTYLVKLTDGSGRNLTQIAADCQTELSEVSRILPLAFLAPQITAAIMSGRQPASLTAQRLLRLSDLPIRWDDQVSLIG
ncbi:recombinase family protein [Shinella sp.]|uniref:recombinase family protein n=1 Tax=Shinella sp. TaxID=1870904 RepID=UPI003F6F1993